MKDEEKYSLSVEAENLAMPEIHVKEFDFNEMKYVDVLESEDERTKAEKEAGEMSVFDAIAKRCSVREFTDEKISDSDVEKILKAGMSGPSAVNSRDWSFVVVRDKKMLTKIAECSGPSADPLKQAAMGILVCGDVSKSFEKYKDFWIIDGSIATQNMILAATGLGIGSVWLGVWPKMDTVMGQAKLFNLPSNIIPHSLVAFGYPKNEAVQTKETFDESLIHYNKW